MTAAVPLPTAVPARTAEADAPTAGAPPILEATRRRLTERQAEVVAELVRAAEAEVDEVGYDAVTVRSIARRAGVAPATAYNYFSSKDHLLAEVLWRRLQALAPVVADRRPVGERLEEAVRGLVVFAEESPALADACTLALLGTNPDVKHLRDRIGVDIHRRLAAALGPDVDPQVDRSARDLILRVPADGRHGPSLLSRHPGLHVRAAALMVTDGARRPTQRAGTRARR